MNKEEAIKAMDSGLKVRHRHFSYMEWMCICGGGYTFEDGSRCTRSEFWAARTDNSWNDGWEIVNHKSQQNYRELQKDELRAKAYRSLDKAEQSSIFEDHLYTKEVRELFIRSMETGEDLSEAIMGMLTAGVRDALDQHTDYDSACSDQEHIDADNRERALSFKDTLPGILCKQAY